MAARAGWRWTHAGSMGLAALTAMMVGVGIDHPRASADPRATGATKPDPLAEPLQLIRRAAQVYSGVRDYNCVMIKREQLGGTLSPNHIIALRVKTTPFSVGMAWHEPKELKGQEVYYVAGKHDGKMRVKVAGLLGSIGFVSLSPEDPRALKTSRHPITSAGIGHLIDECLKGWQREQQLQQTVVKVGNYLYANRPCRRVELIHPNSPQGTFRHYRNIIYFDRETHLPIRVENYGWPTRAGQPGELLESYSYVNLRLNVGLGDEVFQH